MEGVKKKEIRIVYGSQTGNCEEISSSLKKQALEYEYSPLLFCLDDYESAFPALVSKKDSDSLIYIFVISTTGDGEPPENAEDFFGYLYEQVENNKAIYSNMKFTVMGLGNSNYTKYQYIPRVLEQMLVKLGGIVFMKKEEIDDAFDMEEAVDKWIEKLWVVLEDLFK